MYYPASSVDGKCAAWYPKVKDSKFEPDWHTLCLLFLQWSFECFQTLSDGGSFGLNALSLMEIAHGNTFRFLQKKKEKNKSNVSEYIINCICLELVIPSEFNKNHFLSECIRSHCHVGALYIQMECFKRGFSFIHQMWIRHITRVGDWLGSNPRHHA